MDRSPLHPLRLLPALLATADQGRRYFESEIEQWLATQNAGDPAASAAAVQTATPQAQDAVLGTDHPAAKTPNVPPAGETIPEAGQ